MSRRLITILVFFLVFTLVNILLSGKSTETDQLKSGDISVITDKLTYQRGREISVIVQNNTTQEVKIDSNCPYPPVEVYRYNNGTWEVLKAPDGKLNCKDFPKEFKVAPGKKQTISLRQWKYKLFNELGRYHVRLNVGNLDLAKTYTSNEFTIEKESFLSLLWTHGLYRPIYNTLIFLTWIGGQTLWLGIALLTIIIRTVLLIPSQKALRSQKKLQEIQPKLEALKKKHKDNQERLAQETLNLWKSNKVNPLGSCLPLLFQFPILIALFYVIRDGLDPNNIPLLYEPLKNLSLSEINVGFLGLDLTKINIAVLPFVVGGLQFLQIKLQLGRKKGKEEEKQDKNKSLPNEMQMMNQTMLFIMPVMIGFFTASVPAGVGLYWGVSTLYGIGQQIVVNREKTKV